MMRMRINIGNRIKILRQNKKRSNKSNSDLLERDGRSEYHLLFKNHLL